MGAPVVTIHEVSHRTISRYVKESIISFSFDTSVVKWVVCAGGMRPYEGEIASEGGTTIGGDILDVTITWSILEEGQNRINIYGLNILGEWTPYDDPRTDGGFVLIDVDGGWFTDIESPVEIDGGDFRFEPIGPEIDAGWFTDDTEGGED
jgi:hypothetical protein